MLSGAEVFTLSPRLFHTAPSNSKARQVRSMLKKQSVACGTDSVGYLFFHYNT